MLAARKLAIEIEELDERQSGKETYIPKHIPLHRNDRTQSHMCASVMQVPSGYLRHKPHIKAKNVVSWVLFIAVFLFMGGVLLLRYEKLTAINSEVNTLKYQITQLQSSIEDQQINIEFAMDIVAVQEIAENKLEMGYPSAGNQRLLEDIPYADNENVDKALIGEGKDEFDDLFVEPNKSITSAE